MEKAGDERAGVRRVRLSHQGAEWDGVARKLMIRRRPSRPGMPSLSSGKDPRADPGAHRIEMSSDQALHLANKLLEWFLW